MYNSLSLPIFNMRTVFEFPSSQSSFGFLRVFAVMAVIHALMFAWVKFSPTARPERKLAGITVDIGTSAPAVQRGQEQVVAAQSGQGGVSSAKTEVSRKPSTPDAHQTARTPARREPPVASKDIAPGKDAALVSAPSSTPVTPPTSSAAVPGMSLPAAVQGQSDVRQDTVKTFEPDVQAAYKDNPKPPYPKAAFRVGAEGTVDVAVEVNVDGTVAAIKLARSSGNALLDQSALDTVAGWRFRSASKDGVLRKSVVVVPITFRLRAR